MKRLLVILILIAATASAANATVLWWWNWDCSNGSTSYTAAVQDDDTHKTYLLYVGCDGQTCIAPINGPEIEVKMGDLTPPPDFHSMCINGAAVTTPNTPIITMYKTSTGEQLWFRTPIDAAERNEYLAMWAKESGGLTMVRTPEQEGHYSDMLQTALVKGYEEAVAKYGHTRVAAQIDGSVVTIAPVATDAINHVVIVQELGRPPVWSGDVKTPVALTLPDGDYELIGRGGGMVKIHLPGNSTTTLE